MSGYDIIFLFFIVSPILLFIVVNCFDFSSKDIYKEKENQKMILNNMGTNQWFANLEQKRFYQEMLDEAMLQTDIMLKTMPDQLKKQWDNCDPPSLLRFLCKW